MEIIPVIDLLNGKVVRAIRGERKNYVPIPSTLIPSHFPLDVVAFFHEQCAYSKIYIADLNSLMNQDDQLHIIHAILKNYPNLQLWLDNGIKNYEELNSQIISGQLRFIIASEALTKLSIVKNLIEQYGKENIMLSLDFYDNQIIGSAELLEFAKTWGGPTIVLSMSAVGTQAGPNLALCEYVRKIAPHAILYFGGGIRNKGDLNRLSELGIYGALVSSALHSGDVSSGRK